MFSSLLRHVWAHQFSLPCYLHCCWLRRTDSHRRSPGYEPGEILLLHPAIIFIDYYVCPNNLVRDGRIELPTTVESGQDSTSELTAHIYGALGGT